MTSAALICNGGLILHVTTAEPSTACLIIPFPFSCVTKKKKSSRNDTEKDQWERQEKWDGMRDRERTPFVYCYFFFFLHFGRRFQPFLLTVTQFLARRVSKFTATCINHYSVGLHVLHHCNVHSIDSYYIYIYIYIYTGCPRRNVPDFGRVFLMLKYTDITQNTYVQS